ncbi:MAG TPA: FAD-binding oxidoreductase [Lactovum miscens]|uniref:FAD-binding oxidoreductase n=1 Tax=Lactovum miscens TaxID=190387 RepID=UPI002ED8992F
MLKKHKFWLGLFWLITIFISPLPLVLTATQGLAGTINVSMTFGTQVGTVAYVWMLLVIAISVKPHWLDRLVGLPEMYFLHGIVGTLAVVLAFFHKELSPSTGLIKLTGEISLYLFIAILLYSIFFMSSWLTGRSHFANRVKQYLEKIFNYETSIWLHRLNIVATLLVFGHVLLIPYITSIKAYMFWFYLYSGFTAVIYLSYHFIKPLAFHNGRLISNRKLSDNITELVVQLKGNINFRAGDFAFISFPNDKGMREKHPFSILQYNKQKKQLTFTIRNYSDFTSKIDQLKLRSQVKIDGSYGRLYESLQEHINQNLVMIGSGLGSVPLISLVLHFVGKREITFVRVAHEPKDLIYEEFLKSLPDKYSNFHYYSQIGRLSEYQIDQLANENFYFLVGGSNQMMNGTIAMLKKKGVKSSNLYGEKFSF